jgi:hypothetical protein
VQRATGKTSFKGIKYTTTARSISGLVSPGSVGCAIIFLLFSSPSRNSSCPQRESRSVNFKFQSSTHRPTYYRHRDRWCRRPIDGDGGMIIWTRISIHVFSCDSFSRSSLATSEMLREPFLEMLGIKFAQKACNKKGMTIKIRQSKCSTAKN